MPLSSSLSCIICGYVVFVVAAAVLISDRQLGLFMPPPVVSAAYVNQKPPTFLQVPVVLKHPPLPRAAGFMIHGDGEVVQPKSTKVAGDKAQKTKQQNSHRYQSSTLAIAKAGPVFTFVKTDPKANFKWGVRHYIPL